MMIARLNRSALTQGTGVVALSLLGAWLCFFRPASGQETKGTLKAGMAAVRITPPVGTPLSGYAGRTQPSTEVLDDLFAKALVLDDGNQRLALVVCDIIALRIDMVREIRGIIQKQTGIDPDNVMITCTHTHTGPNLRSASTAYVASLKARVAEAVAAATKKMQAARLGVGRGECRVAANRRHPNSPSGPYNLYKYPQGIMDPTVMVLRVEDLSGNVIGMITNYSAHAVGWGSHELGISRDFPGFALDVLEREWGKDMVAVYLQGCCGNLNLNWVWDKPEDSPIPPRRLPDQREPRLREVRRLGRILGGETLKVAEGITDFTSGAVLKAARRDVEVRLKEDASEGTPERTVKANEKNQPPKQERRGSADDARAAGKKALTTEVQVFRVGDWFIVGLPSEVFVEYQIEIRQRSGAPCTFVSELANDSISYVPTPEAYQQGGYEVRSSNLAPDAGKTLVDAAMGLLEGLR